MDETLNRKTGLGIEMPRSEKNTWQETSPSTSGATVATSNMSDSEDYIKPIRLAKRHDPKSSTEEFQFRPIRLSSKNSNRERPYRTSSTKSNHKSIQIKNLPIIEPQSPTPENVTDDMIFAISLVDFHHVRGPEVQWWRSNYHPDYNTKLFKNLPFQALPDGSHLFEETFSNFNLVYDFKNGESIDDLDDINSFRHDPRNLKTLFGCSCVRQIRTDDLSVEERERNKEITRSIVQKAIVIIVRKQPIFTKIKEKLSIITKSYFQQDNFDNTELLEDLFDNLNSNFKLIDNELEIEDQILKEQQKFLKEEEFFVNLNLKNTILKFKSDFLIIFKSLLLEKKILIFSNNNLEMLTQFQNNLISLIPNLINNLDNSGCPLIDYVETNGPLSKPNSLNTNNRKSMLRFFGLPLQIFNTKGSFWNPYLPLQQLDELKTESFMVGCSNLLFVNQSQHLNIDLLINLDSNEISFPNSKHEEFNLSYNDKKFINNLILNIHQENVDFLGNDDYIRYQFEDYLLSLISTMRYHQYFEKFKQAPPGFIHDNEIGNLSFFNKKYVEIWKSSKNFKIWNSMADEFIFNFIDPKHLGINLNDNSQPYKLSNLFNTFKFKPTVANSNDNEIKVQKFIPHAKPDNVKDNSDNNETRETEEFEEIAKNEVSNEYKKPSGWSWGFKRR